MEQNGSELVVFTMVVVYQTMKTTFVTAFFQPTTSYRNPDTYFEYFHHLAETGIPILLFLDSCYTDKSFPSNVRVIPTTLDTTWLPDQPVMPAKSNPTKDTSRYFCIQLSKLRFLTEASQYTDSEFLAWIDFGIFHMLRQPNVCKEILRRIAVSEFPRDKILSPGCGEFVFTWDHPIWMFCGSLLLGHRSLFPTAYQRQTELVQQHLPRLTWEVNYWVLMKDCFQTYPADHNDTLLMRVTQFVQRHQGVETCVRSPD
jgi:hypothetical protein